MGLAYPRPLPLRTGRAPRAHAGLGRMAHHSAAGARGRGKLPQLITSPYLACPRQQPSTLAARVVTTRSAS